MQRRIAPAPAADHRRMFDFGYFLPNARTEAASI
jgi:hypothetical protein